MYVQPEEDARFSYLALPDFPKTLSLTKSGSQQAPVILLSLLPQSTGVGFSCG